MIKSPSSYYRRWMLTAAFAGLVNGLSQAHIIGMMWGGFLAKYTLTVGVFILALGLGSLVPFKHDRLFKSFAWQQFAVAVAGLGGPWIILASATHFSPVPAAVIAGISIFILGFIAGMEFPLISQMATAEKNGNDISIFGSLMYFDYFGMALATFIFPILLLRYVGVFQSSAIACVLNLLIFIEVIFVHRQGLARSQRNLMLAASGFGFAVLGVMLVKGAVFEQIASDWVVR